MNFGSWDRNHDSRLDSSDLLSAFDTDGSGSIDKDELQHFAEQLASQLEYNSQLLGQLQQSEQEKLNATKEVQAKQDALKRTTDMLDQVRGELSETKRKLNVAQEVADTMSNQLRDARLEVNSARRDMDNTIRSCQDMKNQVDAAMRSRDEMHRALQEAQEVIARNHDAALKKQAEMQSEIEILRHMHEAVNKESSDLRAKVFPLEGEQRKLLGHIHDLSATVEEASKRCEAEAQARAIAEKRMKDMTVAAEKMRDRQMELQYSVRESEDIIKACKAKVEEHAAAQDQAEVKLKAAEDRITGLTQTLAAAREENGNLHHELEHLSNELVASARARQQEQEVVAAKIAADKAEMERILRDSKLHADDFIREAENRAAESNEARQRVEKKFIAAQKECMEMHEMVDKLQRDNQENALVWEAQKNSYLQSVRELQEKVELAEEKLDDAAKSSFMDKEGTNQIIKRLKSDLAKRGEQFVEVLSSTQAAVKKLRDEAIVERNKVREIVGYVALLKAKASVLNTTLAPPLLAVKPELEAVFEKLWEKCDAAKEQLEDAKDDVRRTQLSREEERSKTLIMEEQISRLELDLASKDKSSLENERRLQERIIMQKSKLDKLSGDNSALEEKILVLQQSLQETSALAKNLQAVNQQIHASMGEVSSRNSETRQDVEAKVAQLASQLRRTTQERDEQGRAFDDLRNQMSRMQRETEAAKQAAQQAQLAFENLQKETGAAKDKQKLTMSAVGGATQKYQQQLKQNQDILALVQAQRSELQTQNQQMRAELDRLYEAMHAQKQAS